MPDPYSFWPEGGIGAAHKLALSVRAEKTATSTPLWTQSRPDPARYRWVL